MSLARDVRHTLRTLSRTPAFTALALTTLTLGIGVTVAMFTVFNAVLLRPLPYERPDELVRIRGEAPGLGLSGMSVSNPEYFRYRTETRVFRDVGAFLTVGVALVDASGSTPLSAIRATPNLPTIVGARPVLGRSFTAADEQEGAAPIALISAEMWKSRFGADRSIVGQSLLLGSTQTQIVGVLPEGLKFPPGLSASVADVWLPLVFTPEQREIWTDRSLGVIGRLREGQTVESARLDLERVGRQIAAERPQFYPKRLGWHPSVATVTVEVVGSVRPMLLVMMGAVGLVLLIACANVANLLLARASARRREVAVRMAIGGRRGQIVRQFLTESLTLGAIGGVLGVALAWVGVRVLVAIGSGPLPWLAGASIDWRVVAFTVLAVGATGVAFGLAPARFATDVSLGDMLKTGGKGTTATRAHQRARSGLIVAETMLAVVLLAGAGLLVRSFAEVVRVGPGFDPENVMTMRVTAPESRFADSTAARAMHREVFRRVGELPGVQSVSAAHILPLTGDNNDWGFVIEGRPLGPDEPPAGAQVRVIAPDYFTAMRIPLLRGRGIERTDESGSAPVIVVNESFAAKHWPGELATGKRISFDGGFQNPNWRTVVGIVADIRHDGVDLPARPEFYVPVYQSPRSFRDLRMVVRTTASAETMLPAIRAAVTAVDAAQPTRTLVPMTRILADSIATRRFLMLLLVIFASVAFSLAAVGIYGLTSVVVQQRTNELGIRIALGAQRGQVVRLVVWQGTRIAIVGIGMGLALSLLLAQLIRSQLFGVTSTDPLTLAIVAATLGTTALVACWIPARRAARIDPLSALRAE